MSDIWEPEDDQPQVTIPKALRELHEKDREVIKELKAEVDKLRAENSRRAVADVFVSKGYDPGLAELATGVEPNTESVEAWIGKYGRYFAPQSEEPTTESVVTNEPAATTVTPDQQGAMRIFSEAGTGASTTPATNASTIAEQIARAGSAEELTAILQGAQGTPGR